MSMSIEYRRLSSLVPADRNPKEHNLSGIKRSMRELGIADYVGLVDGRTGKLLGGHGRTEALMQMRADGEPQPDGVVTGLELPPDGGEPFEWMVPVLVGFESRDDAHAEAVIIALNQHTITGGWDAAMLRDMLDGVDVDMETVGFTPDALDDLMAQLDEMEFGDDRKSGGFAEQRGGARGEPTLKERAEDYAGSTIRSLVLDYTLAEYEEIISRAAAARGSYGVESNAELFLALLRIVAGNETGGDDGAAASAEG